MVSSSSCSHEDFWIDLFRSIKENSGFHEKITFLGTPGRLGWLKRLTLAFGSGHDLMVRGIEPRVRLCTDSTESPWVSLSPSLSLSLSAPPLLALSLSPSK